VDWIHLAQDGDQCILVNMVMKLWIPQKAGNFLTGWLNISFSRRTLLHGVIYLFTYSHIEKFVVWQTEKMCRTQN